jgi:hypothetical protein
VFTQLPALRELTGELEAVYRHAREAGGLHYLSYPKKFHEIRPERCALLRTGHAHRRHSTANIIRRVSGKVIPSMGVISGSKLNKVLLREQPEMSSFCAKKSDTWD